MQRLLPLAIAASAILAAVPLRGAHAHAVAGARVFVPTLTMDDPGVSDEASIPTVTYQHTGASGDSDATNEVDLGFEYDKTITPRFGLSFDYGWDIIQTDHAGTIGGAENLYVTAKYQAYVNAEHEFIASLGVIREFGGTGSAATSDTYGSTAPTLYVGKGLGDLPIGLLRALGVTGELSYTIADVKLKESFAPDPDTGMLTPQFNNGNPNTWSGGVSFQYSMSYLKAQVKDFGLPDFINRLVPLVEVTWSTPASTPYDQGTQVLIAPGVIYMADTWDVGIEALIPGNRATGTNVGVIAQFHIFLDDLFPTSIGKPIFE